MWAAIALTSMMVACVGGNPVAPQVDSPAARLVHEGDALLAKSDFTGAQAAYQRAIEEDPDYAPAYSHRAFALLFDPADQKQAIADAQHATELQPDSYETWAYLARALDWNGEFDEALEAARRAERLNPDDADVMSFLAEVLADLRMYEEALEAAEQAIRLDPKNAEAHRNLAYVYSLMGRYEDSLGEYETALSLQPEFVHRITSLAAYYLFNVDDGELAAELLDKSAAIAPDDYITLLFLARLNSSRGDFDEALNACSRILEQAPNAAEGYNCRGSVLLDAGLFEEAIRARQIAIDSDPGDDSGYVGLGYAYYASGQCELAARQFERAIEIHPRSGGNHSALGFAYACLQLWDQAQAEYETAIELEPYQGDHHILLGRMHLNQGDFEAAEREIEAAIELDPNNDDYVAWLGRLYVAEGELTRAVAEYTRASAMDPTDGSHELAIGFALLNAGNDASGAGVHFERAMDIYIEHGVRPRELAQASYGLALTHLAIGECEAAIPHLQEAVRLDSSLEAAGEYLAQCRLVSGYDGASLPPEFVQRGQYAGRSALEALTQGLAVMGINSQAEFRSGEDSEVLMFVGYAGIDQPGTAAFLSQQSLVAFVSSLVAARTVVPEVSRLAVVTVDGAGETVGLLEILVRDARLWDLGIFTDAGFTRLWRSLQP